MEERQAQALETLKSENAAMEKEIMMLTKGGYDSKADAPASVLPATGGIRVMKFGPQVLVSEAGIDLGTAYRPAQCARRTVLGGFFTS